MTDLGPGSWVLGLDIPVTFTYPWLLLGLLTLPAVWLVARRWSRSGLETGRSVFSTLLRVLLVAAAVLALADTRWVRRSDRVATIFLLDMSASIPAERQSEAQKYVKERIGQMPEGDRAGLVVFGEQAMIELPPGDKEKFQFDVPHSVISAAATDLGAAIRLALAAFPDNYQRRIVLISDGNENRGHVFAEVEQARQHGVVVNVRQIQYSHPEETWVEDLIVPSDISPKEPFDVNVIVHSEKAGPATLRLLRNDGQVIEQPVGLTPGKNLFTIRQKITEGGAQRYEVHIETPGGDTVYQNNAAYALTHVRGEARLLVVGGEDVDAAELSKGLRSEGIETDVVDPGELANRFTEFSHYDAIIFANVGVEQLPAGAMQAVEAAVHDAGVGFMMIGGERSFGPGGYRGTPLEKVLPVTMDQPQRRVLPNGALVLILHTVEIPEGNKWAKDIGLAAMNTLGPQDYFGVLVYSFSGGNQWLFKPRLVADKAAMARLIKGASPEDMQDFDSGMQMAHQELKSLTASARHMVIISDGDPSGPAPTVYQPILADRITISTVCMNEHSASDVQKMKDIAVKSGGQFYHPSDPRKLPQIFIREAATIRRSMVIEQAFTPSLRPGTQAFKGIEPKDVPPLHGYTIVNPKETTEVLMTGPESDVVFAQWQFGLGKAAVFTSDAKNRWGKDWLAWPNYQKVWAQIVRTILRSVDRAPYTMSVEIENGVGHVVIDALDEEGRYVHTLKFQGSATAPTGDRRILGFRQTGPGRYEADFEASEVGIYGVNATFTDDKDNKGYLSTGAAVPYVAEYRDLKTNLPLLERIADLTGGKLVGWDENVFTPMEAKVGSPMALWPWLLGPLLFLFVLDIAVRRVAIGLDEFRAGFAWAVAKVRRRPTAAEEAAPAPLKQLLKRKKEVRAEQLGDAEFDLEAGPARTEKPELREKPKPKEPPKPPPGVEAPEYLKRLMEAKKRAKEGPK